MKPKQFRRAGALLLLIFFVLFFGLGIALPAQAGQHAVSGEEVYEINGKWEFYWNQMLTPDDFSGARIPNSTSIEVPSSWGEQILGDDVNGGKPLPRFGYATYRKVVRIDESMVNQTMAISFRYVNSAFKIWLDGREYEGVGKVSTTAEGEVPYLRMRVIHFIPKDTNVEILLQISNHSFREPGITEVVQMGRIGAVAKSVLTSIVLQDIIAMSMFFIMSAYHLIVFFSRTHNYNFLWLGLMTLFLALREFLLSEYLVYHLIPALNWPWLIRIEYCIEVFAVISCISLIYSLYPKDAHSFPLKIVIGYSSILIIYYMSTPPEVFTSTLAVNWSVYLVVLAYFMFFAGVLAAIRKRTGALIQLLALFIVFLAILNDLLFYTEVINSYPVVSYAMLIYVLLQAVNVAFNYSKLFINNTKLTTELQTINSELEDRIAERTEELRQSNASLVKLDKQRSQLMENIAHDLGSPIVGAQTHVQLLKSGIIQVNQQEKIYNQLLANLAYMKSLTQDLFDMTGFDQNRKSLQLKRMPVQELWRKILQIFIEKEEWEQISLSYGRVESFEHESNLVLDVDSVAISRVVQNFLDNAIKFTPEEPCPVRISYYVEDSFLTFSLTDFGRGIAEEDLEHLFNRFYRANKDSKGIGLGLAIVKEIVEAHGGRVSVSSKPGEGSTFSFHLPLSESE